MFIICVYLMVLFVCFVLFACESACTYNWIEFLLALNVKRFWNACSKCLIQIGIHENRAEKNSDSPPSNRVINKFEGNYYYYCGSKSIQNKNMVFSNVWIAGFQIILLANGMCREKWKVYWNKCKEREVNKNE